MKPLHATRDANDTTWYVLRYAPDFTPRTGLGIRPHQSPNLDPALYYDADRHVLELLPGTPATEAEPLPGLAVDVDGQVYHVDPKTGRILVRCGASERELVCEHGALLSAAGLALDRRGLLYVADPPAHRVLVIVPDDGSVAGVLVKGLTEPVDVAPSAGGLIYVADRTGGKIAIFDSRFERSGEFVPQDSEGVIVTPRPVAVMIDVDGTVLVADANYPRLLRFSPDGRLIGDEQPHALAVRTEERSLSLSLLERAYGRRLPRFYGARAARAGRRRTAASASPRFTAPSA